MTFVLAAHGHGRADAAADEYPRSQDGSCTVDIAVPHVGPAAAILMSMDEFSVCAPAPLREPPVSEARGLAGAASDTHRAGGTVDLAFLGDDGRTGRVGLQRADACRADGVRRAGCRAGV